MPARRHTVDMKPALGLLPAIWLSQSGLALLVQGQQRGGERQTAREGDRNVSKEVLQVCELTCSVLPSRSASQVNVHLTLHLLGIAK